MSFAAPWLLLALALLPLLWWLLRATPPAPRREAFPPWRLLAGLTAREETPAHTPPWLLLLRLAAAALLIVGLAGPLLHPRSGLAGNGPVLLVIDNSWAAAADWPQRMAEAQTIIDRAARTARPVALLATTADAAGKPPVLSPLLPPRAAQAQLEALRPEPWPPDRDRAAAALAHWPQRRAAVFYFADGIATGLGDQAFGRALARVGEVRELLDQKPVLLLSPPLVDQNGMRARLAVLANGAPVSATILARDGAGQTLARVALAVKPGQRFGEAPIPLPLALRNRLARLDLAGPPSAGGVVLLDASFARRSVGLVSADAASADEPLAGMLYFLTRALAADAAVVQGSIPSLLAQRVSVLILADDPVPPALVSRLSAWVERGGMLIRFAGPLMEIHPDPLVPVALLPGARSLGGTLSWGKLPDLAPFPESSPFAGLRVPADVTVWRELLADPGRLEPARVWARLTDGTPLVSAVSRGRGLVVLFHVTANADWSNLPLSGLFPAMLERLVGLAAGGAPASGTALLAPESVLDGFGAADAAGPAVRALAANAFARTVPSPAHPPGIYGRPGQSRALNLGAALAPLHAAARVPGARLVPLAAPTPQRVLGPTLVGSALALLAIDLIASLALRGLLRWAVAVLCWLAFVPAAAHAATAIPPGALVTRLAYVVTGDPAVDSTTRQGLIGLSEFVNSRSAAVLGTPKPVVVGRDDLSLYPLLYWPITPATRAPSARAVAALNDFMGNGGIIAIDTEGGDPGDSGSGAGFAAGVSAALKRATRSLDIPPLTPLTPGHVLAHTFYLLRSFPGRFAGARVWVAAGGQRQNDFVSPVVIGANDWVAAWAVGDDGNPLYAAIPGGNRQRLMAFRFGLNLVMYALTGTYKADQVHVPAILERLGQ